MKTQLSKSWWFLLIKGLLFIFFGGMLTFYPRETPQKMIFLLGLIILLGGLIILGLSLLNKKENKGWGGLMTFAVIDIALGLFIIVTPNLALKIVTLLIGIWALLVGIYQLWAYFTAPKENRKGSMALYIGLLAVIVGLIMVINPIPATIFMTIIIGILSIIVGFMLVGTSFKVRKMAS
ncbi:MAG: DUF308 domain-containing protein [Bacteroidales bacterium]|nr:DUF308 domain-containing protein [Bacteroidales bacterium]